LVFYIEERPEHMFCVINFYFSPNTLRSSFAYIQSGRFLHPLKMFHVKHLFPCVRFMVFTLNIPKTFSFCRSRITCAIVTKLPCFPGKTSIYVLFLWINCWYCL